jgi:hypothetical protein
VANGDQDADAFYDEIKIYKGFLTASEIIKELNNQKPGKY